MTLQNIVPPFIKDISYQYLQSHPVAEKLFEDYPRRVSHELSFQVNFDTIRLSYKLQDVYGKTFVFVHDDNDWYLENVEYFLGELPMDWWRENEFYYFLSDKVKIIETKRPTKRISIKDFDLKIACKYREEEVTHLSEWHLDRIDESKWGSIEEVQFEKCRGVEVPADWLY
jgi:hypothetical protein